VQARAVPLCPESEPCHNDVPCQSGVVCHCDMRRSVHGHSDICATCSMDIERVSGVDGRQVAMELNEKEKRRFRALLTLGRMWVAAWSTCDYDRARRINNARDRLRRLCSAHWPCSV
jgi:hypothetical protein